MEQFKVKLTEFTRKHFPNCYFHDGLWWIGIFDLWANRKELVAIIKDCWKTGRRKWWLHNLSCELRRGRYPYYDTNDHSDWGRFLFFLGVWLLDPTGKRLAQNIKWHKQDHCYEFDTFVCQQWCFHPYAWVRRNAWDWYREEAKRRM